MTLRLPDPEWCRYCKICARVVNSRRLDTKKQPLGFRIRQHRCPRCGRGWPSFQSIVDPRRVTPRASD